MIESLLGFFALGSLGFWALTIITLILGVSLLENDHEGWLTLEVLVYGILYFRDLSLGLLWWHYMLAGAGFIAIGLLWSVHKWKQKVSKDKAAYLEHEEPGDCEKNAFRRQVNPAWNKSRLSGWVFYWPISVFWAATGGLWESLYDSMARLYKKISNQALAGAGLDEIK